MKNSTVSSGKSRSKISSVGVGQPNARRKMPIVTSMATAASTPATMPTRRTPRKDRAAVDSAVVFTAQESFSPPGRLPTRKHEVLVGRLLLAGLAQSGKESLSQRVARIEPPTLRGFQLVPQAVMALLRV